MCGIAGFLDPAGSCSDDLLRETAERMGRALRHRGPDSAGTWQDARAGVALAHRRLAILDLSALGHQPMVSAHGRYVLTFNGEIYNYGSIRSELEAEGARFRGHSDTEVLLAAIEHWSLRRALERSDGMFALGLWDRHDRVLHLARDRFGEKPLYYGRQGSLVAFASQVGALRAHGGLQLEPDPDAVALYLAHGYVPAPRSIYRSVHKLPPGCMISIPLDARSLPPVTPWWSAAAVAAAAQRAPLDVGADEAADELERLLSSSVRTRAIADVPLGSFLSGGVDSSIVTALLQATSPGRVSTFSVGFAEAEFDESAAAAHVAAHLGTNHTALQVTAGEALEAVPSLPAIADEPLGDSSLLPTYLLARLARRDVTVALSGDGGDELFGGYTRYGRLALSWRIQQRVPSAARRTAANAIGRVDPTRLDRLVHAVPLPDAVRRKPANRLHRLGTLLGAETPEQAYATFMSHWTDPTRLVLGAGVPAGPYRMPTDGPFGRTPVHRCMAIDTTSYLPDDILAKVDRASMAVGLEARVPMLQPELFELAWRLPPEVGPERGKKWLLRRVLHRHVPAALVDRPKQGFAVPMGAWLRGPLRPWAEELLSERRLEDDGLLDAGTVRRVWLAHLAGQDDWGAQIWDVLMLQGWLDGVRHEQPGA